VVTNLKTAIVFAILVGGASSARAQTAPAPVAPATSAKPTSAKPVPVAPGPAAAGVPLPADYVIGPDDVIDVLYWRNQDMSAEVTVRPDGKVTLPLLNDVQAAGLTPDQLRESLTAASSKFVEDPNITIRVKTINSRKVFVTGMVAKPGPYPLTAPTTVMQALAMAGGLQEFADAKNIIVMRVVNGQQVAYQFNYKEVLKRKNLKQNIELKSGDTVVVP
jgi:polysaccharide export outer membrane protein